MCREGLHARVVCVDAQTTRKTYEVSDEPLREMTCQDFLAAVLACRSDGDELVSSDAVRDWCAREDPPISTGAADEKMSDTAWWDADETTGQRLGHALLKFKRQRSSRSTNYWSLRARGAHARKQALEQGRWEVPWNSHERGFNGVQGKWDSKEEKLERPEPGNGDGILTTDGLRRMPLPDLGTLGRKR